MGRFCQLNLGGGEEAEGLEVTLHGWSPDRQGQLGGADVGGVEKNVREGHDPLFSVKIMNGLAAYCDRRGGIKGRTEVHSTGIEPHRNCEDLEDRAHLKHRSRSPVQQIVGRR